MRLEDIPLVGALEQMLFPIDAWPLELFYDEFSLVETRAYSVAEIDGHLVGYCGVMVVGEIADIQTIGVLPEHEGKGIGTAMLTGMLEEARRRGAAETLLEVREDNPRARSLYERFGFEHIHTRRGYYRDGVNAHVMRLVLETGAAHEPSGDES
ncbi:ribosomal-protein-alanine N-acetyltransferase [Arthrobacter sp. JZ12]|uniref:ribosomal protein S18-alanine N-acetyltransferase n=1 Tax=Arthrobacter sp. JZ12 TaxID=2654190 RepID=UPI002B483017|nr:ribosomal protein S18-alanine N-acetyltransferase [Arthrobacter sp. JZ12]WRH25544.1 ribosomal-protein-alanine N-acetyltransferase [Arthrobacter sp. JZ12]